MASVFSRMSFPEGKKARHVIFCRTDHWIDGFCASQVSSNGYYDDYKSSGLGKVVSTGRGRKKSVDNESSDDEWHFKRRPSRYVLSPSPPPPQADWVEEGRHKRMHK